MEAMTQYRKYQCQMNKKTNNMKAVDMQSVGNVWFRRALVCSHIGVALIEVPIKEASFDRIDFWLGHVVHVALKLVSFLEAHSSVLL
jgi:hypothetical protein